MRTSNHSKEILIGNFKTQSHVFARHFFVTISLDVTISASCNWSVAVFTKSLESQESYVTLRNVTLRTRLSITRDFFRQHSTFARLYNAAASPASRLRSAGSLAIKYWRELGAFSEYLRVTQCRRRIIKREQETFLKASSYEPG